MKTLARFAIGFTALFFCVSAFGQANLNFSGGNGATLKVTLTQPVTYTATFTGSAVPFFIFKGVGNFGSSSGFASTITFTINGGAPTTISRFYSGTTFADNVTPTDAVLYSGNATSSSLVAGDLITLTAGTLTSTGSFTGLPPASGSFTSFIVDDFGDRLSMNGVAVPEPATWLGGAGLCVLGLTALRRSGLPASIRRR